MSGGLCAADGRRKASMSVLAGPPCVHNVGRPLRSAASVLREQNKASLSLVCMCVCTCVFETVHRVGGSNF